IAGLGLKTCAEAAVNQKRFVRSAGVGLLRRSGIGRRRAGRVRLCALRGVPRIRGAGDAGCRGIRRANATAEIVTAVSGRIGARPELTAASSSGAGSASRTFSSAPLESASSESAAASECRLRRSYLQGEIDLYRIRSYLDFLVAIREAEHGN